MLKIPSVPSKFLTAIKDRLNSALIKYYVNESKVNWNAVVSDIAKNPKLFEEKGRWDSVLLQENLDTDSGLGSAFKRVQWYSEEVESKAGLRTTKLLSFVALVL